MDPERVRGYLQVACAGLGFDIGEIWWTSNESGTSTLATIGTSRYCRTTVGSLVEFAAVSECHLTVLMDELFPHVMVILLQSDPCHFNCLMMMF